LTTARTVRVVRLTTSRRRGRSGSSVIQQTSASRSWIVCGTLPGRQIRSPRETSRSSASRRVTDIGANASSTGPRGLSMPAIVVVRPLGSTCTSSPVRSTPLATVPAQPR
jgi:hypothetical protein